MEVRDIETRNLTDEIVESMSETGSHTYADNRYRLIEFQAPHRPTPYRPTPVAQLQPIPTHGPESTYETPYSTGINSKNPCNDQSRSQKWSICFPIIWLVIAIMIGLLIGAIVMGLTMHLKISESDSHFLLQSSKIASEIGHMKGMII